MSYRRKQWAAPLAFQASHKKTYQSLIQYSPIYIGEGMNVLVAVTKTTSGFLYFHGAGKTQASTDLRDMKLQRMLGHLSVLARANADDVKDVLVVACGAGVTAGSFVPYSFKQGKA